ncbi:MAG: SHOCT domain-containing protein [Candidatus Limnocylindrales bacterium]
MMNGWARYYLMDADEHLESGHRPTRRRADDRAPRSWAEEALRERFVRGMITREEYEQALRELR